MFTQRGLKKKIKKFARGSISIFLCLLMIPFSTVALGLVELHRYQTAFELVDELTELASLSAMANYNTYMEERFDLFSVSPDADLSADFTEYFTSNIPGSGAMILSDAILSTEGKYALDNSLLLRQQLVDYGESTVALDILLEDINIDEILKKIESLKTFSSFANKTEKLLKVTEAIKTLAENAETLVDEITKLKKSIEELNNALKDYKTEVENFIKKVHEDETIKSFDFSSPLEENAEAVTELVNDYKDDVTSLLENGKSLKEKAEGISLSEVSEAWSKTKTAYDNAKNALNDPKKVPGDDNEKVADKIENLSTQVLQDVLVNFDTVFEGFSEDITIIVSDSLESFKNKVTSLVEDTIGISFSRYSSMVSGSYFKTPISEQTWSDIKTILQNVSALWNDEMTEEEALKNIADLYFPKDVSLGTLGSLAEKIGEAIDDAAKKLAEKFTEKLSETLSSLVNIINNLFNLDVFYNDTLTASIQLNPDFATGGDSPQQQFLNAIQSVLNSVEELKTGFKELNLVKMLVALGKIIGNTGKAIGEIFSMIWEKLTNVVEKAGLVFTGEGRTIYEDLLIDGYMVHNLPNRLSGRSNVKINLATGEQYTTLNDKTLSGFKFKDIPCAPAKTISISGNGISKAQNAMNVNGGTDDMFCGAELEYIVAGTKSEVANQTFTFLDVYFLRLLFDLPAVFMDGKVAGIAAAATVASWVVYILYILAEPLCDTVLLVNGGEVPVIRTECYLSGGQQTANFVKKLGKAVSNSGDVQNLISASADKMVEGVEESSNVVKSNSLWQDMMDIDYKTMVLLDLLLVVDTKDVLDRFKNIIQLECHKKNDKFNLSQAYCIADFSAEVTFDSMVDIFDLQGNLFRTKVKRSFAY